MNGFGEYQPSREPDPGLAIYTPRQALLSQRLTDTAGLQSAQPTPTSVGAVYRMGPAPHANLSHGDDSSERN
jgi:hypothetical protein